MENEFNNLDDLFRDSFSDYSEAPPPAVWPALEKRLDKDKKRRVFPLLRWYWLGALLAFVTLLGATIIVDMKPSVPAPAKIGASPAHTGNMPGTRKTEESGMQQAHNDNAHVATTVPPTEKNRKSGARKDIKRRGRVAAAAKNDVIKKGMTKQGGQTSAPKADVTASRNAPTVGTSIYSYDDFENDEENERPETGQPIAQQGYAMSTQRKHNIVVAEMLPAPLPHETAPETPVAAVDEPGVDVAAGGDVAVASAAQRPEVAAETNKVALSAQTAKSQKAHFEKTPSRVAAKQKALATNDNAVPAKAKPAQNQVDTKAVMKTAVAGNKAAAKTAALVVPGKTNPTTAKETKAATAGKTVSATDLPLAANRGRGIAESKTAKADLTAADNAVNQPHALRSEVSPVPAKGSAKEKVAVSPAHNSAVAGLPQKQAASAKQKPDKGKVQSENSRLSPAAPSAAKLSSKKDAGPAKEASEKNPKDLVNNTTGRAEVALPKNSLEDKMNKNGGKQRLAPAITQDNLPATAKTASRSGVKETTLATAAPSALSAAATQAKRPAINATAKVPPVIAAKAPAEKTERAIKEEHAPAAHAAKDTAIASAAGKEVEAAAANHAGEKESEPAQDSSAKAITPFMRFVFGINGGLESGFSMGAGNKVLVAPYIRYNISEKVGIRLQPAIKVGQLSARTIGNPAAYHNIHAGTGQYELTGTSLVYLAFTGDTLVKRDYTYTEKYDSIVKRNEIGGSYVELELPVLLQYQVSSRLAFYGGLNAVLGKRFSIKEKTQTYADVTATGQAFSLTRLNEPATLPPITGVNYVSSPISSYSGPAFPANNSSILRMGYMLGVSYELKKRWSLEAAVQQCFVQKNMQAGYNLNQALSAPYFRFMVGYRLTK